MGAVASSRRPRLQESEVADVPPGRCFQSGFMFTVISAVLCTTTAHSSFLSWPRPAMVKSCSTGPFHRVDCIPIRCFPCMLCNGNPTSRHPLRSHRSVGFSQWFVCRPVAHSVHFEWLSSRRVRFRSGFIVAMVPRSQPAILLRTP